MVKSENGPAAETCVFVVAEAVKIACRKKAGWKSGNTIKYL
jgi:hypothetical protein